MVDGINSDDKIMVKSIFTLWFPYEAKIIGIFKLNLQGK